MVCLDAKLAHNHRSKKGVRGALAYWVFITTTFLVIKFESQTGLTILESRAHWPRSSPAARASCQVNQAAFRGSGLHDVSQEQRPPLRHKSQENAGPVKPETAQVLNPDAPVAASTR